MSFILDALKKSENERQQQSPAEFASVPSSPDAPGMPKWLWVLGALLVVNIIVLLTFMLTSSNPDTTPTVTQQAPPNTAPATPPEQTSNPDSQVANPVLPVAQSTDNTAASDTAATVAFEEQLDAAQRERPAAPAPQAVTEPAVEPAPTGNSRALLPDLTELRANGTLNVADLHLDMHYLHSSATRSFVFINNDKYREQDTLKEGPRVVEIVADGVVLEYQGRRFILPR